MKILITGFEPFDKETVNPSWEAVKRLPDVIGGCEVIKAEIPVVRFEALSAIEEKIREFHPDIVLSVGQAGGRTAVTPERIGINCDDYRIPDNAGNQPAGEKIDPEGPDGWFSSLPVTDMCEAIRKAGVPSSISNSAGTFVCNHVLYGVRNLCEKEFPEIRSGFIHVPYIPEQCLEKNAPSLALDDIIKALQAAVEVCI